MKNPATAKTVFASFKAKDAKASLQLKEALNKLLGHSRAEEGTIWYEVFQSPVSRLEFYVLEIWNGETALQQHLDQPHLKEFTALCDMLLEKPFSTIALTTPLQAEWLKKAFTNVVSLN
jgi:quinol monooxygenase YgiN